MSKHYKAEDVINAIEDKIAEYIPTLYGRYAEIPLELRMAIEHLPSADVVEREKYDDLREHYDMAHHFEKEWKEKYEAYASLYDSLVKVVNAEHKPIMTEEVREAIMRLSMCARHECRMCQYRLTDDVDECRDRATKCMNTIVDAFTDCGADMRGSEE